MTDIQQPPRRPHKSRLRSLPSIERISTCSSIMDEERSISPNSADSPGSLSSPTPSINSILSPPEKSKYRSRFTEHFESKKEDSIYYEYILKSPKRPENLKSSKSLNTVTALSAKKHSRVHRSSISTNSSDELNLPLDHLMTTSTARVKRVPLTSSLSTPLQISTTVIQPRKFGSNGSILTNQSTTKLTSIAAPMSLNRADTIITRLESWSAFLKSIINWVEEVSKINLISSRGYYQRAYPYLDESFAISTTTTTNPHDTSSTSLVQQNINQSILTIQTGFQVLTMQIAAEQQEFAKSLDREYLPALKKLRKECKEKIHKLKTDHTLFLDELLRRAEVTRSKMMHLSRCCKQADKSKGQLEMDPWVANLLVLRQLKKEVDEENRLRLLMIPIQKEAQSFEKRLLELVKPTIQHCYETLAPNAWDGSDDKDAAPFQLLMDQVMPTYEWSQFVELQKKDFVNENNPTKDYLKINYPNKFHPMVMTLLKGKMQRKYGVRKQFTDRSYILSGYLHQFTMDDKVSPEKTLYIPSTTIIPSIDISYISNLDQKSVLENTSLDQSNTFEICKPASNVLQRDKVALFRTSNREELVTWCRLLIHFSSGASLSSLGMKPNSNELSDSLEDAEEPELTQHLNEVTSHSTRGIVEHSPARSLRSVGTQESFNEPLAMDKKRAIIRNSRPPVTRAMSIGTEDGLRTPTATSFQAQYFLPEESDIKNSTDTESFVTANLDDGESDDQEGEDECHPVITNDFFTVPHPEPKVDDDAISIASTSTAKGPSSTRPDNSPVRASTPEPTAGRRSPSIASTAFDDAQSSLYFSSGSAPNSPTPSNRSSIVSIPDFNLVPEATSSNVSDQQEPSTNTPLSAAQLYKATLKMDLDD
ncbi:hypothetical protein HPULCUR_009467 [Helicostylum pulchrum]|uniref:PH domain-containing protein n=1 Tax=Helicostylum pulchrum TaxID=562976 RepID=A0ABP9YAK9_9FUNG